MAQLWATFLDVGWGDSVFLELEDGSPTHRFALIDSNDTTSWPNSFTFIKRHLERYAARNNLGSLPYPLFDFVAASHAHADHVSGLRRVLKEYGADRFYFPRYNTGAGAAFSRLVNWASTHVHPQHGVPVVNQCRLLAYPDLFTFGTAVCSVLWPPPPPKGSPNAPHDPNNENSNSLVIAVKYHDLIFVTTGDCEADNWTSPDGGKTWPVPLPSQHVKLVQVPHHAAWNGVFTRPNVAPMLEQLAQGQRNDASVEPLLVASCHPSPHTHPDPAVAALLDAKNCGGHFTGCVAGTNWLRTDRNLHCTVWTDGQTVRTLARPDH